MRHGDFAILAEIRLDQIVLVVEDEDRFILGDLDVRENILKFVLPLMDRNQRDRFVVQKAMDLVIRDDLPPVPQIRRVGLQVFAAGVPGGEQIAGFRKRCAGALRPQYRIIPQIEQIDGVDVAVQTDDGVECFD